MFDTSVLADESEASADDLGVTGLADALAAVRAEQAALEARRWALVAQWAVTHQGVPRRHGRSRAAGRDHGEERALPCGGAGTPLVGEFAAVELGVLLGMTTTSAARALADVQNLVHRHPVLWRLVLDGAVPGWKAQHIVRRCQAVGLSLEQARAVDEATAEAVAGLPWTRLLPVLEGRIIEADPDGAEARRVEAATRRYFGTGRVDEHGLRVLYARHDADQVTLFAAVADRIAQILGVQGDEDPVDVRRAKALGVLADPARALRLLAEAEAGGYGPAGDRLDDDAVDPTEDSGDPGDTWVGTDADASERAEPRRPRLGRGDWRVVRRLDGAVATTEGRDADDPGPDDPGPDDPGPDDPGPDDTAPDPPAAPREPPPGEFPFGPPPTECRCGERERTRQLDQLGGVVAALRSLRGRRVTPEATLYVHITPGSPVARVEDLGPVTLAQAREWLGHRHVSVRPVLDLTDPAPSDRYEVPARTKETVRLRSPFEAFPHGTLSSRAADLDHVAPYRQHGPPGQTSADNLAPLSRLHHRVKTHAGWRVHQLAPGRYHWRTPTGHWARVDARGTYAFTPMENRFAEIIDALAREDEPGASG